MRIIFIRHCEPDYSIDSLTEKGWKEARLLAKRVARWDNIDHFYCSPLGRAKDTCKTCLEPLNIKADTLDWFKEFVVEVNNPDNNEKRYIPWDYMPNYWTNTDCFMDKDNWWKASVFEGSDIKEKSDDFIQKFDKLLEEYGYFRSGNMYKTNKENDDTTIVIFCHLGITFLALSHLLNISPAILWHTYFVAPSSLTIVTSEERIPHEAAFRIQVMGDTTHLHDGNEPISSSGYFTNIFQK